MHALIHGNRLIKANIRTTDELRKLWSSPAAKDALRKINRQTELIPADQENSKLLERLLHEMDEDVPDPGDAQDADKSGPAVRGSEERDDIDEGQVMLKIPRKRWLEQIALDELTAKRPRVG